MITTPLYGFLRPDSDDYAYQLGDDMGLVVDRLEQVLSGFVTSPDVSSLNAEVIARVALAARVQTLETKARASVRQTVSVAYNTANVWLTLTFQPAGVERDTAGGFAAWSGGAALGSRWTCPAGQGGLYMVNGFLQLGASVACNIRVTKNGTPIPTGAGVYSTQWAALTGPKLVDLVPGDYIEVQGQCSVAGWGTAVNADGATSFSVVRL